MAGNARSFAVENLHSAQSFSAKGFLVAFDEPISTGEGPETIVLSNATIAFAIPSVVTSE